MFLYNKRNNHFLIENRMYKWLTFNNKQIFSIEDSFVSFYISTIYAVRDKIMTTINDSDFEKLTSENQDFKK